MGADATPDSRSMALKGLWEDAAAVYLYNSQYWEISDLRVTNWDEDAANRERSGIRVEAGGGGVFRHIYIKNCEVFDVRGYRGQDSIWDVDPVGGGTTFLVPGRLTVQAALTFAVIQAERIMLLIKQIREQ